MRTCVTLVLAALVASCASPAVPQKPLKLSDALAWKRIQTPIISNDGKWFAYKLVPNDGNSDLVLTHLTDGKEQRFSIGQIVRPNPYLRGGEPPEALVAVRTT